MIENEQIIDSDTEIDIVWESLKTRGSGLSFQAARRGTYFESGARQYVEPLIPTFPIAGLDIFTADDLKALETRKARRAGT